MGNKTLIRKYAILLTAVWALSLVIIPSVHAGKVQIPEGKQIKVQFPSSLKISSGVLGAGVPLLFYLYEPITIGGKVIVEKGAEGTAVVKESVKAGRGGKPGKIALAFFALTPKGDYVNLAGAKIKLSGTVSAKGKKKGFFPYLFFVLFLKGGEGEISPDSIYTATVAESIILEQK
jgi:hypothetical protein